MNQRFKELALQADAYADEFCTDSNTYSTERDTKFAELIVQECINLIRENNLDDIQRKEWPTDFVEGHDTCTEVLDETLALHFGIEE